MATTMSTKRRADGVKIRGRGRGRWLVRHVGAALLAVALFALFWASRPTWSPEMRLWKAVGDAALGLLLVTMALGPIARLWRPAARALPFRRELGIWFALAATIHTVLILNGWARWSMGRLLGFEFVPQLERTARMEPGFGLANIIGILALIWALVLAATSSDRALRRLGPAAWKWLHNGAHIIFWLTTAHVGYFLFLHYTLSFHKQPPPPDWFRAPFLILATAIVLLQIAAFTVTVKNRRRGGQPPPSAGRPGHAKQPAAQQGATTTRPSP